MSLTVQIAQHGGPEEMKLVDVPVGQPGPGQIRIRHKAIGLNFIDVYQRQGLYAMPMPLNLGMEASGIVEAVGEGVTHLKVGDRAAYASNPPGSYSEARVMPAKNVVKLPEGIDTRTAAAILLKGMTTEAFIRRTYPVKAGETVLVHVESQWSEAAGLRLFGFLAKDERRAFVVLNNIPKYILPKPYDVVVSLATDWPTLLPALLVTLRTTALALLMASLGGLALALLFARWRWVERSLFPFAVVLQVTPIIAIAPLLLVYLDTEAAVLACAFIVAFFPVLSNAVLGLRSVDRNLVELYELYGASRWRQLLLPELRVHPPGR